MIKLLVLVALMGLSHASIVKRADADECYRCSSFDALGQGFIEADDNPRMCGHYKECWKYKDADEITSVDRWCPPGTWVDYQEIHLGAPCTNTECNETMCDDCGIPTASTPAEYECPYHVCEDAEEGNAEEFCYWKGTEELFAGTCGQGGYFNDTDGICTCTNMTVDCTCKVSIPLHDDIDSHGCNGGWVGQLGMPAMATVSSQCGQFNGYDSALNNGAHLGTFVIDGAFAGDWVHSLKWTATFTIDSTAWTAHKTAINPTIAKWGVVTYGDCAAGAAMAFHVEDDGADNTGLVATVETKDEDNNLNKYTLACSVTPGTEYYVAALWDSSVEVNNYKLYCFTSAEWTTCQGDNTQCPISDFSSIPISTATPRGCGLVIGFTGSDNQYEFFNGEICDVSVDIGSQWSNLHPCV